MWVQFWDMHSHGRQKEKWRFIYIEASNEDQAKVIFYNRFGHNPERISCTCCGEDYSIDSDTSLRKLTAYHRNCKNVHVVGDEWCWLEEPDANEGWRGPYQTLSQYETNDDVRILRKRDISPEERVGHVPREGWVWQ